jgi:hypothetical protein
MPENFLFFLFFYLFILEILWQGAWSGLGTLIFGGAEVNPP